jgi:hypothetical protein
MLVKREQLRLLFGEPSQVVRETLCQFSWNDGEINRHGITVEEIQHQKQAIITPACVVVPEETIDAPGRFVERLT